jgi:hypothetical protein
LEELNDSGYGFLSESLNNIISPVYSYPKPNLIGDFEPEDLRFSLEKEDLGALNFGYYYDDFFNYLEDIYFSEDMDSDRSEFLP